MIGQDGLLHYGSRMHIRNIRDPGGPKAYAEFMGLKNGKRVFLTEKINHASIKDFLLDAARTESNHISRIEIKRRLKKFGVLSDRLICPIP